MTEIINNLNTVTIPLAEYNSLTNETKTLREVKGTLQESINHLQTKVTELQEQQPKVKIIHLSKNIDDWDNERYLQTNKVEFVNMADVTTLANTVAKNRVKKKLDALEFEVKRYKDEVKSLDNELDSKRKELQKAYSQKEEITNELKETQENELKKLKKAYDKDVESYNEKISELEEEIQKIKDNKTDAEIEAKRNEEIKTLKIRIKDLEGILTELKNLSFFKRISKLRNIILDQETGRREYYDRERKADSIGTTWVKEGSKIKPVNRFDGMYNYFLKAYNTAKNSIAYTWGYIGL
jgi:chromosome segregation ATPase